jgi:hypothetical protein
VDPGEMNGLCVIQVTDRIPYVLYQSMVPYDNLTNETLFIKDNWEIDHVVIEEYKILPHMVYAHTGGKKGKGITMRAIGVVDAIYYTVPRFYQPANILDTTQLQSEVHMPNKHSVGHWVSAYNHAWRHLRDRGLIDSPVEIRAKNDMP